MLAAPVATWAMAVFSTTCDTRWEVKGAAPQRVSHAHNITSFILLYCMAVT